MTDINIKDIYQMFLDDADFDVPNGQSREEAAWDEALSRYKQHKNNEKALKVEINHEKADEATETRESLGLKKQQNPFAIATAKAKEMGHSDFSNGSAGDKKRDEIAEAIKEDFMKKQYEELEDKWEGKPVRRGSHNWPQRGEAGHSKSRKIQTGKGQRGIKKQGEPMVNTDSIVKSVIQDLIKGEQEVPIQKEIGMAGIAGLLGAGALLGKIFKLENDGDDEVIAKQVIDYVDHNKEFFGELAQLCEYLCSTHDGEEFGEESSRQRLLEGVQEFSKSVPIQKIGITGGGPPVAAPIGHVSAC